MRWADFYAEVRAMLRRLTSSDNFWLSMSDDQLQPISYHNYRYLALLILEAVLPIMLPHDLKHPHMSSPKV